VRDSVERLLLAGLGAVAFTKERAEELADELASRGQMTRDEARETIESAVGRWRGDALRMSERASGSVTVLLRELGLVTRREWEDLELRLAQVEHRLRLVEGAAATGPPPPAERPTEITPPDVPPGSGA
jgi:polyhydroxyalkanoate synthesis regulator phasin